MPHEFSGLCSDLDFAVANRLLDVARFLGKDALKGLNGSGV